MRSLLRSGISVGTLQEPSLLPQPCGVLAFKPLCPSEPRAPGAPPPDAGPQAGAQPGTPCTHSSGRAAAVSPTPASGSPAQLMQALVVPQVPPPAILSWFPLYAFGCRVSLLVGSSLFIDNSSAGGCDFGVLVTGGELEVLLLNKPILTTPFPHNSAGSRTSI